MHIHREVGRAERKKGNVIYQAQLPTAAHEIQTLNGHKMQGKKHALLLLDGRNDITAKVLFYHEDKRN